MCTYIILYIILTSHYLHLHALFILSQGIYVVRYNSAFLISMKLRAPQQRRGLSSARGLAYHRQAQTGVLPRGR